MAIKDKINLLYIFFAEFFMIQKIYHTGSQMSTPLTFFKMSV